MLLPAADIVFLSIPTQHIMGFFSNMQAITPEAHIADRKVLRLQLAL